MIAATFGDSYKASDILSDRRNDRPGELLRLLEPIHRLQINIIDVDVNRHDARPRMGERIVELCIAIKHPAEEQAMLAALAGANYAPQYSRWLDPPL